MKNRFTVPTSKECSFSGVVLFLNAANFSPFNEEELQKSFKQKIQVLVCHLDFQTAFKGFSVSVYDINEYDGLTYYEVEIKDGDAEYELAVEAFTGEIFTVEIDDDELMRNTLDEVISYEAAEKIAVEHFGGNVIDIELDEDDGYYEYEMELMTEHGEVELTIDAVTGEIIESELDD